MVTITKMHTFEKHTKLGFEYLNMNRQGELKSVGGYTVLTGSLMCLKCPPLMLHHTWNLSTVTHSKTNSGIDINK